MNAERPVPLLAWPADVALAMPGSKSAANRLLLLAAVAGRPVHVHGATPSDDVRHLVAGLRTLGHGAGFVDEATGLVRVAPRAADAPSAGELHCGNAGTALRFLVSLAAITPGEWTLTGDAAMQRRPIEPLVAAWRELGVDARATNGCPPVHVRGGTALRGGRATLDARVSSQFVSSLLLVGARLPDGLELSFVGDVASFAYARWTAALLTRCGVHVSLDERGARVRPGIDAIPSDLHVEGDWSSMGVWTCLQHLTGSRVHATNLRAGSEQADEALATVLASLPPHGPHTLDVRDLPDQFLNLAVTAAHRTGPTTLISGANLRIKECDRIAVVVRELRRLGVDVDEHDDGITVHGGRPLRAASIDPAGDHRVAMAFALAGLRTPGVAIADPDCVTKSYPRFWADLARVVQSKRPLVVVGMRGAGKSTLARALAAQTGSSCVDTDAAFVAAHGPIAPFVQAHGWPAFRAREQELVAAALQANTIVATGGGAVTSAHTRSLLRDRAHVVWLDAPVDVLRARLAVDAAQRPSLTGAPVLDELAAVLAERTPLYAEVAHVRVDATLPLAAQCAAVLR